ncbi:hypothetical protein Pecwa_0041 [Pectobacterium parmentieri WPP163]|uniref:hypothetical protein n=1 Tax=Pectobacterium parmentieri TaxID=1905730 RepID=UPI0001B0A6CB|nr:hypothetical protein [Pectobacterium parmentieri]ACX85910.1 hypothetical protein Pecwa_0041 [Pectobacterium parmentieri WPP163]
MKKILLLIGILLGIGLTLSYQWVNPPFNNPYFFLSPKISTDTPINIPIKLYEKGDEIDFTFWKTPLPLSRFFLITPLESPSSHIVLKIKSTENLSVGFYTSDIFIGGGPIKDIEESPIFNVELYKINNDLTEKLILKKVHRQKYYIDKESQRLSRSPADAFGLVDLSSEPYGQYRLKVKVLGDWPELKIDNLHYFITIETYFVK